MGFGLHAGWAIEGAVGSLQKVDATYLSPHVNMAARLETSSKQYGVPLLASQDFYDLMSNEGQSVMRRLDVVTVKGSEVPIGIYTYDALQDQYFKEDSHRSRPSLNSPDIQDTQTAAVVQMTMMSTKNNGGGNGSVKLLMESLVGAGHNNHGGSGPGTGATNVTGAGAMSPNPPAAGGGDGSGTGK